MVTESEAKTSPTTAPFASFIEATGGTITTSTSFKIHTFTGDGCFVVSNGGNSAGSNTVDYLVVAGGGAGGAHGGDGSTVGGGGGAGGYRESSGAASGCYTVSPLGACVAALPVSQSRSVASSGACMLTVSTDSPITLPRESKICAAV